jgi:hypothetical protein
MAQWAADRWAISDVFTRYAQALDSKQWTMLEAVFTEDARADWPGDFHHDRRQGIIDFVSGILGTEEIVTHHFIGAVTATIDGDRAEAQAHMRAVHDGVGPREGLSEESLGSFSGTLVRTPAGWRFDRFLERIFTMRGGAEVFGLDALQADGVLPTSSASG